MRETGSSCSVHSSGIAENLRAIGNYSSERHDSQRGRKQRKFQTSKKILALVPDLATFNAAR